MEMEKEKEMKKEKEKEKEEIRLSGKVVNAAIKNMKSNTKSLKSSSSPSATSIVGSGLTMIGGSGSGTSGKFGEGVNGSSSAIASTLGAGKKSKTGGNGKAMETSDLLTPITNLTLESIDSLLQLALTKLSTQLQQAQIIARDEEAKRQENILSIVSNTLEENLSGLIERFLKDQVGDRVINDLGEKVREAVGEQVEIGVEGTLKEVCPPPPSLPFFFFRFWGRVADQV